MFKTFALTAIAATIGFGAAANEWQPEGPITLKIAFRAGGGTDTQARLIAQELTERFGWEVIPQNIAGNGGATMALDLVDDPADGLTIGMTVTEALTYTPLASRNADYSYEDFDLLTTTAGSQVGIVARADRGWETLADVIAAAQAGEALSIGTYTPRVVDGTYLLSQANDIELTTVSVQGGRGGLNGVMAEDIDLSWVAGPQAALVASGDVVNLVSAEGAPLAMSPDAPLLEEFGVPFTIGANFLFIAPQGIPAEAEEALVAAILEVITDESTEANAFINRAFGGVVAIHGEALDAHVAAIAENDEGLLTAASE